MANQTKVVFGTQTEVTVASPGTVANGAFSVASDVSDWTNTNDYPLASFVLVINDLSATPTSGNGGTVGLYCKPLNIVNTTGDHEGPGTECPTIYLGSFVIKGNTDPAGTNINYVLGPVALPHVKTAQEYEFYIKNNITNSAIIGVSTNLWELWVTPLTYGPT